jgi:N4-gp56 family major capsid protein
MGYRITTTSTGSPNLLQDVFLAKRFVETLESRLVVLQLADKEDTPRSSGTQVRWQFFANPSAATTALTEGADPSTTTTISTTAVTGVLQEYGAYFDLSKLFIGTSTSGTKEEIVKRAAYMASLTLDTLCFTLALQDTTTTADAGVAMSAEDVRTNVLTLEQNDAFPHPATPGGQYFCGVFSPEAAYDMMGEGSPTWFQTKSSDFRESLVTPFRDTIPGAAIYNCIIKTSTNVQAAASEDLNYIIAGNSFGALSFDSDLMNPRIIDTAPEALVSAPLRNRGTLGWHVNFDAAVFDSNRIVEVTSDQS